jgi:internalin A
MRARKFILAGLMAFAAAPVPAGALPAQDAGIEKTFTAALKKANPDFNGKAGIKIGASGEIVSVALVEGGAAISDLSPLKGLHLTSARICGANVRDVEPLRGMPLTSLDLQRCRQLSDSSALQDMPLTTITLYNCKAMKDISPLKNAKLTHINFEGTAIKDLSPLKGQPLEDARICCPVLDLTPLAGMSLRHVDVGGGTGNDANLDDIRPLQGMKEMRDLRFDQTSVSDISVVREMKSLKLLAMFTTRVKDLSPIQGLELETLLFSPRNFPPEQIQLVRGMKSLKRIDVSWRSWPDVQSADAFCEYN